MLTAYVALAGCCFDTAICCCWVQQLTHYGLLMFSTVVQVAARELRAAAQGASSKLIAQHSAAWAQRTIQVEA